MEKMKKMKKMFVFYCCIGLMFGLIACNQEEQLPQANKVMLATPILDDFVGRHYVVSESRFGIQSAHKNVELAQERSELIVTIGDRTKINTEYERSYKFKKKDNSAFLVNELQKGISFSDLTIANFDTYQDNYQQFKLGNGTLKIENSNLSIQGEWIDEKHSETRMIDESLNLSNSDLPIRISVQEDRCQPRDCQFSEAQFKRLTGQEELNAEILETEFLKP